MLAKTKSCAVIGVDGYIVEVEVNAPGSGDITFVSIVGLPDAAVKESRDRIKSALNSSGLPHLKGNTIVNLAPADIKKVGASFDLAIAMGMLAASGQVKRDKVGQTAFLGELGLDGSVSAPCVAPCPLARR